MVVIDKKKLSSFVIDGRSLPVQFVTTQTVKEGVKCEVYAFEGDNSRDLAIVTVQAGHKTPLQRVLSGNKTIEGFISGEGELAIRRGQQEEPTVYNFKDGDNRKEVVVGIGQIIQWEASINTSLVFYEICYPPYREGRFENLSELLRPTEEKEGFKDIDQLLFTLAAETSEVVHIVDVQSKKSIRSAVERYARVLGTQRQNFYISEADRVLKL